MARLEGGTNGIGLVPQVILPAGQGEKGADVVAARNKGPQKVLRRPIAARNPSTEANGRKHPSRAEPSSSQQPLGERAAPPADAGNSGRKPPDARSTAEGADDGTPEQSLRAFLAEPKLGFRNSQDVATAIKFEILATIDSSSAHPQFRSRLVNSQSYKKTRKAEFARREGIDMDGEEYTASREALDRVKQKYRDQAQAASSTPLAKHRLDMLSLTGLLTDLSAITSQEQPAEPPAPDEGLDFSRARKTLETFLGNKEVNTPEFQGIWARAAYEQAKAEGSITVREDIKPLKSAFTEVIPADVRNGYQPNNPSSELDQILSFLPTHPSSSILADPKNNRAFFSRFFITGDNIFANYSRSVPIERAAGPAEDNLEKQRRLNLPAAQAMVHDIERLAHVAEEPPEAVPADPREVGRGRLSEFLQGKTLDVSYTYLEEWAKRARAAAEASKYRIFGEEDKFRETNAQVKEYDKQLRARYHDQTKNDFQSHGLLLEATILGLYHAAADQEMAHTGFNVIDGPEQRLRATELFLKDLQEAKVRRATSVLRAITNTPDSAYTRYPEMVDRLGEDEVWMATELVVRSLIDRYGGDVNSVESEGNEARTTLLHKQGREAIDGQEEYAMVLEFDERSIQNGKDTKEEKRLRFVVGKPTTEQTAGALMGEQVMEISFPLTTPFDRSNIAFFDSVTGRSTGIGAQETPEDFRNRINLLRAMFANLDPEQWRENEVILPKQLLDNLHVERNPADESPVEKITIDPENHEITINDKRYPIDFGDIRTPSGEYTIREFYIGGDMTGEANGEMYEVLPFGATTITRIIDDRVKIQESAVEGDGWFLGIDPQGKIIIRDVGPKLKDNPVITLQTGWTGVWIAGEHELKVVSVAHPQFDDSMGRPVKEYEFASDDGFMKGYRVRKNQYLKRAIFSPEEIKILFDDNSDEILQSTDWQNEPGDRIAKPFDISAKINTGIYGTLSSDFVIEREPGTTIERDRFITINSFEKIIERTAHVVLLDQLETSAKEFGASRIQTDIPLQEAIDDPTLLRFYRERGYQVTYLDEGMRAIKSLTKDSPSAAITLLTSADIASPPDLAGQEEELAEIRRNAIKVPGKEFNFITQIHNIGGAHEIGICSYATPDGTEAIVVNKDKFQNAWGGDFTRLIDIEIEREAVKLLLTRGGPAQSNQYVPPEHYFAINAAVEKAQREGLLDDYLELKRRQMQHLADAGDDFMQRELNYYEVVAERIRRAESETAQSDMMLRLVAMPQDPDYDEINTESGAVILSLVQPSDPPLPDQQELNADAAARVAAEHDQLAELNDAHAREMALTPFLARLQEITLPTGEYALAIKGIAEDLEIKRQKEETGKIRKEIEHAQSQLNTRGTNRLSKTMRAFLRTAIAGWQEKEQHIKDDGTHTMLGYLQNPNGVPEDRIPVLIKYRTETTNDHQTVTPVEYGQFLAGSTVQLSEVPTPLISVGFDDRGSINTVTDRTLPVSEVMEFTGMGAQTSAFLGEVANQSGDGLYTFIWQDLTSDPKLHTSKYASGAGYAEYRLDPQGDGRFEESQGRTNVVGEFTFDTYKAMLGETLSKIKRYSLV